ncbi:MAG: KTSC domain-containing protein [Syntrophales bacterium]|nr:KTSC domain-containing protein [Syntrophales bacterium]
MERTSVSSTNINSIGYAAETQTLEIEFIKGSVYQYAGVPVDEYEAMMSADSKGKYFHTNIKDRYSFTKL